MRYTIISCLWFLILLNSTVSAQMKPEPPTLFSVTIDPESGNTIIRWLPSTSADVDYYTVYELLPGTGTEEGTSISGEVYGTSYETSYNIPHQRPVGFMVKAFWDYGDSFVPSIWNSVDSTIYLEAEFDSCLSSITLSWNEYTNWHNHITEYGIYRYLGPGLYDQITSVPEGTNSFVINDVQANQSYDIFIRAEHNDGVRSSTSNRREVNTTMSRVPGFINADYATISPGRGIDLSFSTDGIAEGSFYRLLRSNSFDGSYEVIDSFYSTDTRILYTDEISFTGSVRFYRLEVLNNCAIAALESNKANNIILNAAISDYHVALEWNEYRDWQGGVSNYQIIRTIGRENPVTDTLQGGITTYYGDDISAFPNYENPSEGLFCYAVIANENTNIYGIQGKSQSNQVCFSINPGIRIPNAFIPNDNEPVNQLFEPVFSFLPDHYEMIIYNRLGLKIWEGSEAWDGRVNGSYVPEGIYIYYIRVFNHSSEITELNGKVTVVYR